MASSAPMPFQAMPNNHNQSGHQFIPQYVMDSHMFPESHSAPYAFSPDVSLSVSPPPVSAPYNELVFMNQYQQLQQQQHQSQFQQQVPLPLPEQSYVPQLSGFPQRPYIIPGYYNGASIGSEGSAFFGNSSEYFHDQLPLHQQSHQQQSLHEMLPQQQEQHSSSICMAPTLFNSPFMNVNGLQVSTVKPMRPDVSNNNTATTVMESFLFDSKTSLLSPTSPQVTNIITSELPSSAPAPRHQQATSSNNAIRHSPYPQPQLRSRPMRQAATIATAATAAIIATSTPSPVAEYEGNYGEDDEDDAYSITGSESAAAVAAAGKRTSMNTLNNNDSSSSSQAYGNSIQSQENQQEQEQQRQQSSVYNKWTPEEDSILRNAVARVTKNHTLDVTGKWVRIANLVPNRSPIQCSARWSGALNNEIVRGKWTSREDELLVSAVHAEIAARCLVAASSSKQPVTYGEDEVEDEDDDSRSNRDGAFSTSDLNWQKIALAVHGRTGVQCAARYQEALDPEIRKGKWLEEEDALLLKGLETFGKSWVKIAANIPNRTQRQCRTRWLQMFPKLNEKERIRLEEACGSPIAVNEKLKKKRKPRSGAASLLSSRR
ncbi:hypothetical protein BDR26DRAFT_270485 [Obelidium mucronatum]|nr:hypothetical protein BDR26DRAFT_270485 [Obelidium mucronatum]